MTADVETPQEFESRKQKYFDSMTRLSTVDGRESPFVGNLPNYLSEDALHRYRAYVEVEHLIALSESEWINRPIISDEEKVFLRTLYHSDFFDSRIVAEYDHFGRDTVVPFENSDEKSREYVTSGDVEGVTERSGVKTIGPFEHDVKSVEFYIREHLPGLGLERLAEYIHIPMTSEDTNNLAWGLMLKDALNNEWVPNTLSVMDRLQYFSTEYAHVPVLGKTHEVDATPTTFGKRFSYELEQMTNVMTKIRDHRLSAKLSGPVGNDNAMFALSDFDYNSFARGFVESLGFVFEENANQRSSHLEVVRLFNEIKNMDIWGRDLCETIRHSIAMGWFFQEGKETHVGSSVMPHKVNPWKFEVGQGTLEKADREIDGLPEGLMISVWERELTDHPHERGYGEILGKSMVGFTYIKDGLDTVQVDDQKALEELQTTPLVLSEAIQIAGRILGVAGIYDKIKLLTRGKKLDKEMIDQIIEDYVPDSETKSRLLALKTEEYIGRAPQIALNTAARYETLRPTFEAGVMDDANQTDAVLFDFDNTLQKGDKEELHARLGEISQRMNLGFTSEQVQEFGNRSDYMEMRKLMVDAYNMEHPDSRITEDEFEDVGRQVSGTLDHKFYLAEGAKELLDQLKAKGKKLGLVTTRGANSLPRLLEMHGIANQFDVVINRADTQERKPHPQPLALALERLGIDDSSRTMYVGDLQTDDVIAGKALGVKTVLVSDQPLDKYGAKPDYHYSDLEPLAKKFNRPQIS